MQQVEFHTKSSWLFQSRYVKYFILAISLSGLFEAAGVLIVYGYFTPVSISQWGATVMAGGIVYIFLLWVTYRVIVLAMYKMCAGHYSKSSGGIFLLRSCSKCKYDVTGINAASCPECGSIIRWRDCE